MKKIELIVKLQAMPANELAALTGRTLGRGRPSKALREALVARVLADIAAKKLVVRKDGTIARRGV